jgi:hypothetical protein
MTSSSMQTDPPFDPRTPSLPAPSSNLLWRRFHLAVLVFFAVLLGPETSHADAAPEIGTFVRLIKAQVNRCTWKVKDKAYVGRDLASHATELTVSEVKWDDDHVYFRVTLKVLTDMQGPPEKLKVWVYDGAWSYTRDGGTPDAPELKLTEEPKTISPQITKAPPRDRWWLYNIRR